MRLSGIDKYNNSISSDKIYYNRELIVVTLIIANKGKPIL